MLTVNVHNLDRPLRAPLRVRYCATFLSRMRGLMFHPPLKVDEGILLVQERENRMDSAIHMFFMRMDLTVVWLNTSCEVVDVQLAKRWRPAYIPRKPAKYVMEISDKQFEAFHTGDRLDFIGLEGGNDLEG